MTAKLGVFSRVIPYTKYHAVIGEISIEFIQKKNFKKRSTNDTDHNKFYAITKRELLD